MSNRKVRRAFGLPRDGQRENVVPVAGDRSSSRDPPTIAVWQRVECSDRTFDEALRSGLHSACGQPGDDIVLSQGI